MSAQFEFLRLGASNFIDFKPREILLAKAEPEQKKNKSYGLSKKKIRIVSLEYFLFQHFVFLPKQDLWDIG